MKMTPVEDCGRIDLDRHALIEASAGTGKTYTLETLVVRILRERPEVRLENLLMVTFTEKATGELRTRIRQKIADELADAAGDPAAGRLRTALETFDTAAICTIHGFCHRLLTEFAFESGALFDSELIDDRPLYEALLREQMRRDWPRTYGRDLPDLLRLAGCEQRPDAFLARLVNLAAGAYRPQAGDRFDPDPAGHRPAGLRNRVAAGIARLGRLAGTGSRFRQGFERLNINAATRRSLLVQILEPVAARFPDPDRPPPGLGAAVDLIRRLRSSGPYRRHGGMGCLRPRKWLKKGANPEVCPDLEAVVETLEGLDSDLYLLGACVTVESVRRLQAEVARTKAARGWMGYDDLLGNVLAALTDAAAGPLLAALRKRYRYAFVDEFQDTDPVQWAIFRTIFLAAPPAEADCRLFLIGDPKQAIYAFRGADIHAYLQARRTLAELAGQGIARIYSLATNWRSHPDLIADFNRLFNHPEWFPPAETAKAMEIGYRPVHPPPAGGGRSSGIDAGGGEAFNVIDLSGELRVGDARRRLAESIAREIRSLVDAGRVRVPDDDGALRPLDYGDCCILVRGRPELRTLEKPLRRNRVPYSFYRRPGLFDSDEALSLDLVLRAIGQPGDPSAVKRALLTPFFDCSWPDIRGYASLPPDHPVRRLLATWSVLAAERRWGRLFQSLTEDSGMVFRLSPHAEWERTRANYSQLFEFLAVAAARQNLDLHGVLVLLDRNRRAPEAGLEGGIHRIETDRRNVQVMTLHVSKGLEFPVVFIAGGLGSPPAGDLPAYHETEGDRVRKVINLRGGGRRRQADEREQEDRRLFYVGLTRARLKLYVPYCPAGGGKRCSGPVGRFLATCLDAAFGSGAATAGRGGRDAASRPSADRPAPPVSRPAAGTVDGLPRAGDYRHRVDRVASFSSLHAGGGPPASGAARPAFLAVGDDRRENDEPAGTGPRAVPAAPADEIPGGAATGSMFHDILERIDYGRVYDHAADPLAAPAVDAVIRKAMRHHRVDECWSTAVARVVADTLTTPVDLPTGRLALGSLLAGDRIHEAEFYCRPSDDPPPGGRRPALLRGFVDLIFRHGGRYYVADWKSNRLDSGYGPSSLEESMRQSDYRLQYRIYVLATLRWLSAAVGEGFDPGRHFGGVLYVYLRGMGRAPGAGVYFVPPGDLPGAEELAREMHRRVEARPNRGEVHDAVR